MYVPLVVPSLLCIKEELLKFREAVLKHLKDDILLFRDGFFDSDIAPSLHLAHKHSLGAR
jgi:hypothetical protein